MPRRIEDMAIKNGIGPSANAIAAPRQLSRSRKVKVSFLDTLCVASGLSGAFILSTSKSNKSLSKYVASDIRNVHKGARISTSALKLPCVAIKTPASVEKVKTDAFVIRERVSFADFARPTETDFADIMMAIA